MNSQIYKYKNANISYRYIDTNKATTLVCLHGFLEYKEIFNFLEDKCILETYNLLFIDLLGHGKTDNIGYVHTMENQADMIFELINYLSIKDSILIGHSMGGYVGLSFLNKYDRHLKKLILLNSSSKKDSEERISNRQRAIDLIKKNKHVFIQMAVSNLFKENIKRKKKDEILNFRDNALKISTQGCIASIYGMIERKDHTGLLVSSNKIIYINGVEDVIILNEDVTKETLNTPSISYFINGGHMLWLENPEDIKKLLLKL